MGLSRRIVSYVRANPSSRISSSRFANASERSSRISQTRSSSQTSHGLLGRLAPRDSRIFTTVATRGSCRCSQLQQSSVRCVSTESGPKQASTATSAVGGAVLEIPNPNDCIEVFVDGHSVQIPKGMTVFQACEVAGVDIPRFCYHPRLSIAGNCRMCLVEVEKSPKPVASCAMPAMPGMKIKTHTPMVLKAREGVMEFLLANHPLDCPICDQGGECDLQDQSMEFGSDRGRFIDVKRTVLDKNLGPLVKTVMTRCIQCTRCVRFATEIAGIQDLGVLGRGGTEEIGTYVERAMSSELSGNVIDICPVGALTSKPFAFTARSWEMKSTESIDVSDAVGSNIRINSRGPEVMRIIPRLNEDVNEEWISDKARFCYDGLKRQRLSEPMIRNAEGRLEPVSWFNALQAVASAISKTTPDKMVGIAGKLADAESMMALKDLMNKLGCENLRCEGDGSEPTADIRADYLMNTTIAGLEKADVCLLIGTQLRNEAPMVNARLRKAVRSGGMKVASVGPTVDLTYKHDHLGTGTHTLLELAEGRHPFAAELAKAKFPVIIVGGGVFERNDRDAVMAAVQTVAEKANIIRDDWNGFNVLLLNAAHAAGLDLGLVPGVGVPSDWKKSVKFVYLLGVDDTPLDDIPEDAFVVYQGHHGDRSAYRANVILPGATYTEKEGTYANTEGRVQQTSPAVPIIGDARDDWKILRAVSEVAKVKLHYDTLSALRARMLAVAPNLFHVDELEPSSAWLQKLKPSVQGKMEASEFKSPIENFYMTNAICRASKIMAQCTATFSGTKG